MLKKLLNNLFFGKKKLFLAFEYGVVLADVAQKQGIELTPEIVARAEKMLENEFRNETASHLAVTMVPNILSVFEIDMNK